jgi:hypothetical protein
MNHQDAIAAVLTVGEGRGFVVETDKQRLVITAAHCLPYFPPCASISNLDVTSQWKLEMRDKCSWSKLANEGRLARASTTDA